VRRTVTRPARPLADGTLEYHVVDVFTDRAYAGNPLAVVLGGDGLAAGQLQALAREFNLSETCFPLFTEEARAAGADYRLRIFTTESELPFAGHPSVGTAWILTQLGLADPGPRGRLVQLCGAGALPLTVSEDGSVELSGAEPHVGPLTDPVVVAAAGSLAVGDLVGPPPRACGTGIDFAITPVRPTALRRAMPDLTVLRSAFAAPSPVEGVLYVAWPDDLDVRAGAPVTFPVRMFSGDVAAAEDPATGSAALALATFLVATGVAAADGVTEFVVRQGVELGRPATLRCRVVADAGLAVETYVAGQVVPIASGTIVVPEP
jgi:trans-2,3-dihydro-3-hydroxyanthranilate isomerase